MQCLYCQTKLDPLRVMVDGKFCSDDHALLHAVETHTRDSLYLFPEPDAAAGKYLPVSTEAPPACPFEVEATTAPLEMKQAIAGPAVGLAGLVPISLLPEIRDFAQALPTPLPRIQSPAVQLPLFHGKPINPAMKGSGKRRSVLPSFSARLLEIPTYLKVAASVIPIMFLAALNPGLMNTFAKATDSQSAPLMAKPLQQMKDSIRQRAAVILTDDFRSGLDSWESRSNLASTWAYDPNGFVRPTNLAVYRPSMGMKDYTLEFLTQVEQKGVGAAFRVEDWTHYYAVKLMISRRGDTSSLDAVHYAVVNGREMNRVVRSLNVPITPHSLHRIRLDVHGNDFTLINQGKIVDYWSDGRYSKGGVGFFCGKGERAGVRWVEVSHQQDLLGRFCAFLTPDDGPGSKSGME